MTKTKQTESLLLCLSLHLSSRPECRQITYRVEISQEGYISFDPNIVVFPSIHRKKHSDKVPVLEHVLVTHMKDLSSGKDKFGRLIVSTEEVVPGIYEYESSFDNKRRRWVRRK